MTDYRNVFRNTAIQLHKKGDKYKNKQQLELARYYYSMSVPYFCESAILAKIYGDTKESEECLNKALNVKNILSSEFELDNFSLSVFNYAEGVKLILFQDKFEEGINKLILAKNDLNNASTDEYDPLYHSWILCEMGFSYKNINEIEKSIQKYLCGFVLLKSLEIKNQHYKTTRKYLQHIILAKPEEIYKDTINELYKIALSLESIKNFPLASIYFCEAAILQKIKEDYCESKKLIERAVNLINKIINQKTNFSESVVYYIKGIDYSLKSDFSKYNGEIDKSAMELTEAKKNLNNSIDILKVKNIDHLILSTLLNRELAYCQYNTEFCNDVSYYKNINKLINELDWSLTLYERTLGLFYNFIGAIQMQKLISNEKLNDQYFNIEYIKTQCKNEDRYFLKLVETLTDFEWHDLKIEVVNMHQPLFDLDKSLTYLADVNDEIVVAATHIDISQIYIFLGNSYRAELELDTASKIISRADNIFIKAQFHHARGYIKEKMRDIKTAVDEYTKAIGFAKQSKSERAQVVIYNNIIPLLIDLRELETALDYCKKAINLIEKNDEKVQDKLILTKLYLNYSLLMALNDDYLQADMFLKKSKKLSETLSMPTLSNSVESLSQWINRRREGWK